jgi:hypothetical protein
MAKYLNKGGVHIGPGGVVVEPGKTFVSNDPELCVKFPNKFELIHPEVPTPVLRQSVDTPEPEKTEVQVAAEKGAEGIAAPGKDVTSEFDGAADGGLTVRKDKRGWWVYDEGEDAINEKPLKKREVPVFIAECLTD